MKRALLTCGGGTAALAAAACALFLLCMGCLVPFDLVANLLAGWALFLYRVVPRVSVSAGGVLTAAVCLAGLAGGLHAFFGWLSAANAAVGSAARWPWRWTLGVLGIVVLLFAAGTAAVGVCHQTGWLLTSPGPLVEGSRDGMPRIASANNLKQMVLATHNAADTNDERLPPGAVFDAAGRGLYGWQAALLPYLEEEELYKRIDRTVPWDDARNAEAYRQQVEQYLHPAVEPDSVDGYAASHYAANVRVFGREAPVRLPELAAGNGTSNTILFGETSGRVRPWGYPANWRDPARGLGRTPDGFGGPPRQRVTQFGMADGSVRSFADDTDPEFLKLIATPKE